jgi:multidrug efflux pump
VNLQDDYEAGRSEITVIVDREAAASVGVDTQDVANTVRAAVNGMVATKFRAEDDEYDIIVRLPERSRDAIEDIGNLRVATRLGEDVILSSVAEVTVERGFGSIRHVDGDRVVTITADAGEGVNAQALLMTVQRELSRAYDVPPGYDLRYTGQNRDQEEAQAFLGKALLGAMFLIFITLVTQFNSLLQPGIILISVILSLLGVLWILMLRQLPFNVIMTGVGIISLAGVVVNNAIVLIDYINQLKARGITSKEAVIAAGLVRFRPVMLTAVTTVLSLMPLVMGFSIDFRAGGIVYGGSSVEMWGPMANAVVAGLVVATMLTLIVVPVMYSTIDGLKYFVTVHILRREPDPTLVNPRPAKPKRQRRARPERSKEKTEAAPSPGGATVAEGA